MGGRLAVTIRFSNGEEWRDATWTNIIPLGLLDAPFFLDPVQSEAHTREWLQRIMLSRREDPDLADLWGNKGAGLVPDGYGVLVVDYVNKHILSRQGYCAVGQSYLPKRKREEDERRDKYDDLTAASLTKLLPVESETDPLTFYEINSFWTVDESTAYPTQKDLDFLKGRFALSPAELKEWEERLAERA